MVYTSSFTFGKLPIEISVRGWYNCPFHVFNIDRTSVSKVTLRQNSEETKLVTWVTWLLVVCVCVAYTHEE
jgi:hypothetical protein